MEEYVLPAMANLCNEEVTKMLTAAGSLAITGDAWTDLGGRSYLGVTGHIIKEDWTRGYVNFIMLWCHNDMLRYCAIDLCLCMERKTADTLYCMTEKTVNEHTGTDTYVAGYSLDGETAAQSSAVDYVSEENMIWCVAHRLSLVTKAVTEVADCCCTLHTLFTPTWQEYKEDIQKVRDYATKACSQYIWSVSHLSAGSRE